MGKELDFSIDRDIKNQTDRESGNEEDTRG
jgi:hypothetical protein